MNNPLVSVIVPNYCHSRFLDERIMSVLNQTYQNFELIILDDCSPDNGASRAVIEKYRSNPKVSHIVYNEVNSGSTFKQWNKGIELSKGELIWIAESDDSCEANLLEELINFFIKNKKNVIAFCGSELIDENGKIFHRKLKSPWNYNFTLEGRSYVRKYMLMYNSIFNASAVVFKKDAYFKIPKDYEDYRAAGDRIFWSYIAYEGNVSYFADKLNKFRQHSIKVSKNAFFTGITDREDANTFIINSQRLNLNWLWKQIIGGYYYNYFKNRQYDTGVKEHVVSLWKSIVKINIISYIIYKLYIWTTSFWVQIKIKIFNVSLK